MFFILLQWSQVYQLRHVYVFAANQYNHNWSSISVSEMQKLHVLFFGDITGMMGIMGHHQSTKVQEAHWSTLVLIWGYLAMWMKTSRGFSLNFVLLRKPSVWKDLFWLPLCIIVYTVCELLNILTVTVHTACLCTLVLIRFISYSFQSPEADSDHGECLKKIHKCILLNSEHDYSSLNAPVCLFSPSFSLSLSLSQQFQRSPRGSQHT